jgi:Tol biopolymer transport system component
MKAAYSILTLIVICGMYTSCDTKHVDNQTSSMIPYPQPFPDTTATIFLPHVVSDEGLDFNSAFSPDGKSFYFTRSKNRQWDIYVTTHDGKNWSEPKLAPFSHSKFSEADPTFSPDGKLYFISNRPKQVTDTLSDFDIWFIELMPNQQWTEPKNFAQLNSDSSEYYISFAANGNAYFGSSRPGGFGAEDIYVCRFINGEYTIPENLGSTINTKESEHDPCIWPSEEYLVFKSENQTDNYGEADLYCSKYNSNKKWTKSVNLGDGFNTKTYEYCPYLTADSKYFFFSSESDIKWIDAKFVEKRIDKLTQAQ